MADLTSASAPRRRDWDSEAATPDLALHIAPSSNQQPREGLPADQSDALDTDKFRIPGAGAGFDPTLYDWSSAIARSVIRRDRPPLSVSELANVAIALSFCAGVGLSVIDTRADVELITGIRIRGLSLRTLILAKAKIATACGGEALSATKAANIVDQCARVAGVAVVVAALRVPPGGGSASITRYRRLAV
jgi:hypothetical protein